MTTGPEPMLPLDQHGAPEQSHPPATLAVPNVPPQQVAPLIPNQPGPSHFNPVPAGPFPPAPPAGYAIGVPPAAGPPPMMPPVPAPKPRGRRSWLALVAMSLAVLLAGVVAWQGVLILQLNQELDGTRAQLREGDATIAARLDEADKRVAALEDELGSAFNAERIADKTLPSVFRVSAGPYSGTAFAIGANTDDGGTNFFTNYHVVEDVWSNGKKVVYLERGNKRYKATIIKVDEDNDVAHLRTTQKFDGLQAATEEARSGQQIVVVGAPLGLEDTVTTGVISALRPPDGDLPEMIQFDAAINPGNSGGPVINAKNEVVGIATAVLRNTEGIGLAVPIATACDTFKVC